MTSLLLALSLGLSPIAPQLKSSAPKRKSFFGEGPLYHENEVLYIPASLAGGEYQWFILDTGSHRSYLTKRGYERLKANRSVPRKGREFGPLEVEVVGAPLGKARLIYAPDEIPTSSDTECDGIIGLDVLKGTRLGIDVAAGKFRVYVPRASASLVSRHWFGEAAKPLSTQMWSPGDGTYTVMIGMANLKMPACVDTGCEETYLAQELAAALRPAIPSKKGKAFFYFGVEDVQYYRVPQVALEGTRIPTKGVIGAVRMPNNAAILGIDVLRGMRALFDFPSGRFHYVPLKAIETTDSVPAGLKVHLPTGVTIRWPLGEVVRVDPGCDYEIPEGYRKVGRPDGTFDLVPPGAATPPFKRKPPLLLAPTIEGRPRWTDRPAHVPPKAKYTVPPGWRKAPQKDGSIVLYPPR